MSHKIRWGIISTANIAKRAMIPALQESKLADVLAVASRDRSKARQFADELGIPQAYGHYQALLDDPQVDAVYIPLPNHLHMEWSIRTAEAGKHILCEKPLALNPNECLEMISAAKANGVQLMEAFMYRHHPRIVSAHEMVRLGKLGTIRAIESAFTFQLRDKQDIRYQPEMGGGALMDVGCYCVNISRMMAGREPNIVQARAVLGSTGVDEQLTGLLDFGDGLMAHFDCGFNLEHREHCIIAGSEGYFELQNTFTPGLKPTQIIEVREKYDVHKHSIKGINQYRLLAEDFMRSIEDGKPTYPIGDALANMRTIKGLHISANQNGQPVVISSL
jgi:predicted dehydrogenase